MMNFVKIDHRYFLVDLEFSKKDTEFYEMIRIHVVC